MKTVGQVLQNERVKKNISLGEAEKKTKIRLETLEDIEADDFSRLFSSTYIKGFITLYGEFLGLDQGMLLALFRRQFDEKQAQPKQILPDLSPKEGPKFTFTPRRVFIAGIALLAFGFLTYLFMQYQSFAAAPSLQVLSPRNNETVNNGTIQVVGRTDPAASVSINGQQVNLTSSGEFSVSVTLPAGTTSLTISSTNKIGRVSTVTRFINVEALASNLPQGPLASSSATPAVAGAATSSANPNQTYPLEVILKMGPNLAKVIVQTDSSNYSGIISAGSSQTFYAQSRVVVTSSDAGSTDVFVNGVNEGVMGREGQTVTKYYSK